ncbi:hypothetical protein SERLA73DRAFT_186527 [Serpula lacrymans var. lacrymans S7.3]|uniref:Kinetochore protein Spc24 n=2 Tax=Serpula lacrymans var. lacrymans TaxID=341189 RepID=F8Q7F1_SERL3|nr:uncharacterized protein SERLADRAFT_475635 [Serpula lacrymans var. lacrymans S7.9]EGN95489.1 hypothetical protein SERLA73DRAFT_186527 [Serpula lacrymans var. lacrymans S7.3]EGO21016.1 hypothetical protein SERLADRAFT_475635 [Serpula lacrymans var. lacrymans S7.9]
MAKEPQSKDMQDCIKLLREMTTMIDPTDDFLTITAAEERMKINHAKGKQEIDEAYANMKALSRVLEGARKSSTRPSSVPTAEQHAAQLNDLDATRLSLAKAIRDAEGSLSSKEAELAALKEEAHALEELDPAQEHQRELDGATLRLKIYRAIGFDPVVDEDGAGTKMLIRGQSGDVYSVPEDRNRSAYEDANLLWKLAST